MDGKSPLTRGAMATDANGKAERKTKWKLRRKRASSFSSIGTRNREKQADPVDERSSEN